MRSHAGERLPLRPRRKKHQWLRRIAEGTPPIRCAFWQKIDALPTLKTECPVSAIDALRTSCPTGLPSVYSPHSRAR